MVGIGPRMGVTYVSKMYGGRVSDLHVRRESGELLNNLRYILICFAKNTCYFNYIKYISIFKYFKYIRLTGLFTMYTNPKFNLAHVKNA